MGARASKEVGDPQVLESIEELKRAKQAAGPDERSDFFNRTEEVIKLLGILSKDPWWVTLLVGPIDSGKSKLVKHLEEIWVLNSDVRLLLSPFLLINMREQRCTTPEELARAIVSKMNVWQELVTGILNASKQAGTVMGMLIATIAEGIGGFMNSFNKKSGLEDVLESIREYVSRNSKIRPIIIFDEANMLKHWEGQYESQLQGLIHFFLWMTKETGKGHVLLATSDDFFRSWLRKKLESSKLRFMELGYFSEDEAKNFTRNHIHGKANVPDGFDSAWNRIHEVTGGSPYLLMGIVNTAIEYDSWEEAVASMVELKTLEAIDMLDGGEVEEVLKAIVRANGAVGFSVLVTTVFKKDLTRAKQVIQDLVKNNLVHVRLWLPGMKYKDLPVSRGTDNEYIMAINPAAFAAMKKLVGNTGPERNE